MGERFASGNGSQSRAPGLRDEVLARCLDRLNAGESVDLEDLRKSYPEIAEELIQDLEVFQQVGVTSASGTPLGTLGDYTLRRQIGRGGMGVVYEAWENSMDRRVALKVLPPGIAADERAVGRFIREAQLAGRLNHPNVVSVYGMGVKEQTPYYAMEFVEGETLAQVLARNRDSDPETETPFGKKDDVAYFGNMARAFADVADGLQHAHSKGVIHRDVKPSNLILDREGRLRILDFGLAHLEGQESLTLSGDFVGTPLYMSPEQARRRKIPVDHRTDVYSLGVTMYEALCGRPPFRGKDHEDTLSQIIECDPVEPRKVNPRVPQDLHTIVLKCLQKDAGDRYGTAEALGQDLRRFVRGDAIEARPQGAWERAARRLRRARRKLALAAALLAFAGAAAFFAARERATERERSLAAYEPAVLDAVTRIAVGRFSIEAAADSPRSFVFAFGEPFSPITAEDIRALVAGSGSSPVAEAASALEALAAALPEERDAHYHLARACRLLRRPGDARREVARALACDPGFVPARVLLWEIDGEPGGLDGTEFGKIRDAAQAPEAPGWRGSWLLAYESLGRKAWPDAARAWGELIDLQEEPYIGADLEAYLARGAARLETRDFARAQGDFAVARALAGGLEPALLLAKAFHLDRKEEIAGETLEELHANAGAGRKDEVALWAAAVYQSLGDPGRGLAWAERLEDAMIIKERLRAFFLFRLRRNREAIVAGDAAVARNKRDPVAHLVLGFALIENLIARGRDSPKEADIARLLAVARAAAELGGGNALADPLLRAAGAMERDFKTRRQAMAAYRKNGAGLLWAASLALGVGGAVGGQEGYFDEGRPVEEINSFSYEFGPTLTEDGLILFFTREGVGAAFRPPDIWVATRPRRDEPFGEPVPVAELNTEFGETNPSISPDGLTLYFSSDRPGGAGSWDIYVATRKDRNEPFGEPQNVPELNTELCDADANPSADGAKLYFARGTPGYSCPDGGDLYEASWSAEDGTWGDVRPLAGLNTAFGDFNPSVSRDGRTLFWSSWFPFPRDLYIWMATLNGEGDFEDPRPVKPPSGDMWVVLSPWITYDWPEDGSKLYYVRCTAGCPDLNLDIWEATWHLVPPPGGFRRGDCNDDGTVDITDAVCILNWLFLGGTSPGCVAVTNTNGDTGADISDATYFLNHLFLGGPAPVAPFPECAPGTLPTDEETCETRPKSCR